jgi:hypothetical protein
MPPFQGLEWLGGGDFFTSENTEESAEDAERLDGLEYGMRLM